MSINENLQYIKQGLNAQEQILEQAIAGERFFRKHKHKIYAILTIIVLIIAALIVRDFLTKKKIAQDNLLYSKVLTQPTNQALINELESSNINLFALFALTNFKNTNNLELVNKAITKVTNPELKEILLAAKGEKSKFLQDYDTLVSGFEQLKNGQSSKAKMEFSKIPENSALKPIANNIQHYQGSK